MRGAVRLLPHYFSRSGVSWNTGRASRGTWRNEGVEDRAWKTFVHGLESLHCTSLRNVRPPERNNFRFNQPYITFEIQVTL